MKSLDIAKMPSRTSLVHGYSYTRDTPSALSFRSEKSGVTRRLAALEQRIRRKLRQMGLTTQASSDDYTFDGDDFSFSCAGGQGRSPVTRLSRSKPAVAL